MKKKLFVLFLAMTMSFALIACQTDNSSSRDRDDRIEEDDDEEDDEDDEEQVDEENQDDIDAEEPAATEEEDIEVEPEVEAVQEDVEEVVEEDQVAEAVTLESYYTQPAQKEQLDSTMEQILATNSNFSDVYYTVEANALVYGYVFSFDVTDQFDSETVEGNLASGSDAQLEAIHAECGVEEPIKITFEYYNVDGSLLGSYTFEG